MRRLRTRTLLGIAGVILLFVGLRRGWLDLPLGLTRAVVAPVGGAVAKTGDFLGGVTWSVIRVATLSRRVRELEETVARFTAERARDQSALRENAELRKALGLRERTGGAAVAADVIGVTTDGVSAAQRINRGMSAGVREGAAVVAADGVVVGRIRTADVGTATVELLTSGSVRITARTLETGAEGIVHGVRGLEVIFGGVPRTQAVNAGDRLVTTGLDGAFPPHLFVGTITAIRAPENAIFQEASVQLPLDLHRLAVVSVLQAPP